MSAKSLVASLLSLVAFIPTAYAADAAPATDAAAASPLGMIGQFLLPLAFFAIFYFLIIRPQSKRAKEHRAMIDGVKEGNEVVFAGGLMGRIKKIQGDYAVIALNATQEVMVQRASIISVLPAGTIDGLK